jgi:acyl-CoA dehydrogenase
LTVDFSSTPDQDAIRDAVRDLCARYPDGYWRDLDSRDAYPDEFV